MIRLPLNDDRLIRVGKAERKLIANWDEGVSLQSDSGLTIAELTNLVATDRWHLADRHHRAANRLLSLPRPPYRTAISRLYYAMYHAMRAAAFIFHNGDDHEAHKSLPQNVPDDFPDKDFWANALKTARLVRNSADYDPYPKHARPWAKKAQIIKTDAKGLVRLARDYLRSKGCQGL